MKQGVFLGTVVLSILLLAACRTPKQPARPVLAFFGADSPLLQYMGRIDFSNPRLPRFWASGVTVKARFTGPDCYVILNDEMPGRTNHNYVAVIVDDARPVRLRLQTKTDTLHVASGLSAGEHTLTLCKNTESGIGYLEFVGLRCQNVVALPPKSNRRIEFIGNSITCGTGMDTAEIPCDSGQWYDQHNAYMAYGPRVARQLNAQYHLTSVSGIGLIHSCCQMTVTMPDVFDKINQRTNAVAWDFSRYTPDAVTIALGQNDGVRDSTEFCRAYVQFITTIRGHYPQAHIICLTSPMADARLTAALRAYLTGIVGYLNQQGDSKVHRFFFARAYNGGCGGHPNLAEHERIAAELTPYLKTTLGW